jgi:glycerol-1-phosphate dehydrogenase [NAD(P)+]
MGAADKKICPKSPRRSVPIVSRVFPDESPSGSAPRRRCACGATHDVPIEAVVIDENAFDRLGGFLTAHRWSRPFVVMDANTEEVAGGRVVAALAHENLRVGALCFPERHGLLADEAHVARLDEALAGMEADSIVAVGSGVITDLTRYVASHLGRPFISVPTAASMDGYASGVAAMEFGGMKTTFAAVTPVAIFAEPVTVAAAPAEMTRAGLGDLLGKATARLDWLASHALYGEAFCAEVARRVIAPAMQAAAHVDEILERSPEAISRVLHGLIESGVAMAMVGSSRPASGCEHHASHFWDLLASQGRRPHASHGLQVGYATHFAMRLQKFAFGGAVTELAAARPVDAGSEDAAMWFAGHRAELDAVLEEKRRFLAGHASAWPGTLAGWEAVRERVGETMNLFPAVKEALCAAGIPAEEGFLDLDRATLRTTFRVANRIRSRYTVLDFLEGQGRLDEAVDAVVS